MFRQLFVALLLLTAFAAAAQPCNTGYTITASPPPVGGQYEAGQTVTICYTVTSWSIVSINWFHGVGFTFGAGWDLSTLAPGPPPQTCGESDGTWGWYTLVDGTANTALPPLGPGYFFDLNNDGNPGNNFGDLCDGDVNWQFCITITTASGAACVDGASLNVTVNSYGDSETGSWGTAGCAGDPIATLPATLNCCEADAGSNGAITLCANGPALNLSAQLGGTPDAGGTWTAPGGGPTNPLINPATATGGNYTYTVTNGTCTSSAIVAVTIHQPPNAGTDGTIDVCASGAPVDLLNSIIGEQPGGVWSGPGGGPFNGIYDPAQHASGTYTYTVNGTAPCVNDQASVVVSEHLPPHAGTDASITICADGAPFDLLALLGAADAGGSWSGPGGMAVDPTYAPGISAPGNYTYSVAGTAPCANDQATITITQNAPVYAGADATITVCDNGPAVDLFALLGTAEAGGVWSGPNGASNDGAFIPGTGTPGTFTYTMIAIAPCANDEASVVITQNAAVDAGADGAVTVCTDGVPVDLATLLGGSPDAGGTWTLPGGGAGTSLFVPGTSMPGTYTYNINGIAPCPADQATVLVTLNQPVDAGGDGALTVCSDGGSVDLFTLLGGTPDGNGTWTAPGGGPVSETFVPGTSVAGTYMYTITAVAPCANDQALVAITVNDPVYAGTDGSTTLCSNEAPIDLFTLLTGADPGGTWTDPAGGMSTSTYTPGVSIAGTYVYSIDASAPCANDQATVVVTENQPPLAGTDAATVVCADDAAIDLFTLLGATADAGGTWSGPGGSPATNTYSPGTSAAGAYTYTVTPLAPCPADQATITVTENTPVDAGVSGVLTLCSNGPTTNLLPALGGNPDAFGTWTAPSGGISVGSFTPGTDAPGIHTYTVTATAPCLNAIATVFVAVDDLPDPGIPGSLTLCTSSAPQDLFNALGGTPDPIGEWTAPDGTDHSGILDPANDAPGTYTYTIPGRLPCTDVSSTVTVTLQAPPDPGSDGATLLCATSAAIDLLDVLEGTPDTDGSWSTPGSDAFNGAFVPGTDAPGIYTYSVIGAAPCPTLTATVEVAVTANPDAGSAGSITLCTTGAPQDLFQLLGGTPDIGGAWTAPGGAAHPGTLDPAVDVAGNYTYQIVAPAPCATVSSVVTVTLQAPPDPGTNGSLLLCVTSPATELFGALGGAPDPVGSWSKPNGDPFSGSFLPGTYPSGMYTYTVTGTLPCPSASAAVQVQVVEEPDPGIDGVMTLCATDPPVPLIASLSGTPDAGGVWTDPNGFTQQDLFDPATDASGTYTYTLTEPPPCASASSMVNVVVHPPPNPGTDGSLALCISGVGTSLFDALNGTPQPGGSWTGPTNAATDASFVPGTDAAGTYTYTIAGNVPCPSAGASVEVTVYDEPDAGTNGAIVLCESDAAIDLFTQLGAAPDAGGTWTDPNGNDHTGIFDPTTDLGGIHVYTIDVPPPCSSASSTVTVLVQAGPDPGLSGAITLCSIDAPVLLFPALGGNPAVNGTWTSPSGNAVDGTFDPSVDVAGNYTYSVAGVAPCPMASSIVAIDVNTPPNAGGNGDLSVCASDAPQALLEELIAPDSGGAWAAPDGIAHPGTLDPSADASGLYTYTVAGNAPCPSDAALVMVTIQAPPDAGQDASLALCSNAPVIALYDALGGTPEATGTWSFSDGSAFMGMLDPGVQPPGTSTFTYTVLGSGPCPNASAQITVRLTEEANAGANGAILLCSASPAIQLFDHLGGGPVGGGSWTAPDGAVSDGTFDPGSDTPGLFTYTVPGIAPCPDATATVLVNVSSDPDAGSPGETVLCRSDAPLALLDLLEGDPDAGGSWSHPDGSPHSGTLDPSIDPPGTYTYLIAVPPPCLSASSTVAIMFVAPADPGSDGNLTLCSTDSVQDLFSHLAGSPATGGTWSLNGLPHDGTFDPSTGPAGSYRYTLASEAPCPLVSALVEVAVNMVPDPGTNGDALLCASGGPVALFPFLGGSPAQGGSWAIGALPHMSMVDPGADSSGMYIYTVPGLSPCPSMSALVNVTIVAEPDAGTDGLRTICASGTAIDLFAELGGTPDPGGSWSGPVAVVDGQFDPATMIAGTYIYHLDVPPPCTSTSSSVEIITVQPPDPGSDGALTVCITSDAVDLLNVLNGDPQAGGSWSAPDDAPHAGLFSPASDAAGAYTYTVQGEMPCPSASALVTVSVMLPPDAGSDASLTLCPEAAAVDLFGLLGGFAEVEGTWISPVGGPHSGTVDPAIDPPGTYLYALQAPPPCRPDTASVVLAINDPVSASVATTDPICNAACDGTATLTVLSGAPGFTLQWSGNVGDAMTLEATGLCAGAYGITITDANGCIGSVTYAIDGPEPLVIDAVGSTGETCIGSCDGQVEITDAEGTQFSVDGGNTWGNSNTVTGLCAGAYGVMMQDADGCLATAVAYVGSPPPVIADFLSGTDTLTVSNTMLAFTDQSTNAQTYLWDFAGLGSSTVDDATYTFPDVVGGTYTVCLTVQDANGCADSTCRTIVVLDELLVNVPNAFTPDGDGLNDLFVPVLNIPANAQDYSFMIFDRWGLLLFTSEQVGGTWDGNYNGAVAPPDVYVWKMRCTDRITHKPYDLIGHVTVVR